MTRENCQPQRLRRNVLYQRGENLHFQLHCDIWNIQVGLFSPSMETDVKCCLQRPGRGSQSATSPDTQPLLLLGLRTSTQHLPSHSEVDLPAPGGVVHEVNDIAVGLSGHWDPIHVDELVPGVQAAIPVSRAHGDDGSDQDLQEQ